MQATNFYLRLLMLACCGLATQAAITTNQQNEISVQTSSGLLVGQRGRDVHKFLGVPYARAPLGPLRFQPPQELPQEQRDRLVQADRQPATCPQYRHLERFISPLLSVDQEHRTSEDCLRLSLYVPAASISSQKQLPVLVWLPGEGFDFADARQFDAAQLAQRTQSVVAVVQYRVGALGFLHAPHLNITGNQGLQDQIQALKWIQRNVAQFGGDSKRVTLAGRFSGAMSISALLTAPQQSLLLGDQGLPLFTRAALLSGLAVPNWIIDARPQDRLATLLKATKPLCGHQDELQCLTQLPLEQLMRHSGYGWRLVRDDLLIGSNSPTEAVAQNQLHQDLEAVLLGETGQEGTICLYRHLLEEPHTNYARLIEEDELTQEQLEQVVDYDARAYFGLPGSNLTQLYPVQARTLRSRPANSSRRQAYLDACSAYMVKTHADRFKRQLLAHNRRLENRVDVERRPMEIYHYELRYRPSFSLAPAYVDTAAHGDDIPLIFGLLYNKPTADAKDLLMTRKMQSYLADFIHGRQMPVLDEQQTQQKLRAWSNEGHVDSVRFTSEDAAELASSDEKPANKTTQQTTTDVQLVIAAADPVQQQQPIPVGFYSPAAVDQADELAIQATSSKSRRLVELHRQQVLENNNIWYHISRPASSPSPRQLPTAMQEQQPTSVNLVNESSFMTLFVFSSCTMVFILMSICLGLCLLIIRYNIATRAAQQQQQQQQQQQHHQRVTLKEMSCQLCDVDGHQVDMALQAAHKKERNDYGNVFAKLRNHHNKHQPTGSSPLVTANGSHPLLETGARCHEEEDEQGQPRCVGGRED